MNWEQMNFSDETTIRRNTVKGLVWKLTGKKKMLRIVKHSTKMNVWRCFSNQDFSRIVCFKQNFNAELMCDIYKRDLVPTARKQFGLDSIIWELQEDNEPTHTRRNAHSTGNQVIESKKKNVFFFFFTNYQPLISAIKRKWKSLPPDLVTKLVHSMNNRVSKVIKSDGDFILR